MYNIQVFITMLWWLCAEKGTDIGTSVVQTMQDQHTFLECMEATTIEDNGCRTTQAMGLGYTLQAL